MKSNYDYERFLDININIEVVLGSVKISLKDLLKLEKKILIDLQKNSGEGSEIYADGRLIARGEIIVLENNLAIRINEIPDSDSIYKYFKNEK